MTWKLIAANWEKWLFRLLGVALLIFAIWKLEQLQVGEFTALFAVAFFCWFYANISRFKRFKGFGFEAELWEDKQREAEKLIDRLKAIVGLYSRELLLLKTREGRWGGGGGNRWAEVAHLLQQIENEHKQLSSEINLDSAKVHLSAYFIFDAVMPRLRALKLLVEPAITKARAIIAQEHPQPITDSDRYGIRLGQLPSPQPNMEEPLQLAQRKELTAKVVGWFGQAREQLKTAFGIEIVEPKELLDQLRRIQELENERFVDLGEVNLSLLLTTD